jgi:flagellar biogenesis protein FliO
MPSTIRILSKLLLILAMLFAGIWALATFVEPTPREMTVNVPIEIEQ